MARKPFKRYDLELVKAAARGRWREMLTRFGGVSADVLDGKHHPCPKCGGTDRFRAFDDFDETGGITCNQCHPSKNATGFDSLRMLCGWDFGKALREVADYLGIKPENVPDKKSSDPAEHLEFLPWNSTLIALWCMKKPPITPAAVQAVGGRFARYRRQYTVIALPVYGPQLAAAEPVGWVLYNASGGLLPVFNKDRQVTDWVKVKTTPGTKPGLIGVFASGNDLQNGGPDRPAGPDLPRTE